MILFKLLYLGSLTTGKGHTWVRQKNHYIVIENVPLTESVSHIHGEKTVSLPSCFSGKIVKKLEKFFKNYYLVSQQVSLGQTEIWALNYS